MIQSTPRAFVWAAALTIVMTRAACPSITFAEESPVTANTSSQFRMLSNEETWQRLPPVATGGGQPLPSWARMLAVELPRTTAAFLELDVAQRTKSPIEPGLRAAMRWVSAHANHCRYAEAYAVADAIRAGIDKSRIEALGREGYPGWSSNERAALTFAFKMTIDSDSVTDEDFAGLVKHFGEKPVAAMVLLTAYANFQDRFLLCLDAPIEEGGPLAPVDWQFSAAAFVSRTTRPPTLNKVPLPKPTGRDLVNDDADWSTITYETLQSRLEAQRQKPTRLRIPTWDEVARNLPAGLMQKPSDIIWYRIVFGYAPELALPFEMFMRTAGAEASPKWDRIFGQSLFWVTTRAVKCAYCMGHCEMNWEVAGLNGAEIAERSRLLAGDDWSSFAPAEQHAFAFARKLTTTPGNISRDDVQELISDMGCDRAVIVILNACRYHYMTRISNGFQLTLERENVFFDYYNVQQPSVITSTSAQVPNVTLLSVAETWKRMPKAVSGGGQELPNWARAVAMQLPRTAAAMLQLDLAQRTKSPIDPLLRGKMRWVIAQANRCNYTLAYALADLERAGLDASARKLLTGDPSAWPATDREPLEFARQLTLSAPLIRDELFKSLQVRFGDKQVAAMVLLAAYGNFQDRIVLGLNLPLEDNGPLNPLEITFADDAFQLAPLYPAQDKPTTLGTSGTTVVTQDLEWSQLTYADLQSRLEAQRNRKPRLPIPEWAEVKKNLPTAMAATPTQIVWNLVCSGYVPELAVPWSTATRTMWSESKPDRVFEESLFWIQTRSLECSYCMGHCEMLLEAAGLDKTAIAERTSRLAGSDWSAFPPEEQRAYAYARKLSRSPWELTAADYQMLETDLGPERAMATFWWLCRGLYMTRVSDGFQLPLERNNVFQNPLSKKSAAPAK